VNSEASEETAVTVEPYRSTAAKAKVLVWVLGVILVANLVDLVLSFDYASAVHDALSDDGITLSRATSAEDRFGIVAILFFLSLLAGAITFIVWFRRAYRNVPVLAGQPLPFRAGWAVWGWFVPIIAFFRPKEISNAIWLSAEPDDGEVRTAGNVPAFMNWWWGFWIAESLLGNIAGRLISIDPVLSNAVLSSSLQDATTRSDLHQEYAGALVGGFADVLTIPAAVLAILFVRRATERQERKAACR
jgi:hypothetical protein